MVNVIKAIVEKCCPAYMQLALRYQYHRISGTLDPEMILVNQLLDKRRRFLDIGANVGLYSYFFSSQFAAVESFEPIEEITYRLRALNKATVRTHSVGLSNHNGEMDFYVPIRQGELVPSLASLEIQEFPAQGRKIEVRKVDDYEFDDVDLIKIDVEGHESRVLEGAAKTIAASKPWLIVEIEQRHITRSIDDVIQEVLSLGYDGYYLIDNELINVCYFRYSVHQAPFLSCVQDRRYINNFIFRPRSET